MATLTNAARLAALEAALASVDAGTSALEGKLDAILAALAPASVAPVAPVARDGFLGFLDSRAASRKACEVHAGCTRAFTPASSGATTHVACTGCAERKHHHPAA